MVFFQQEAFLTGVMIHMLEAHPLIHLLSLGLKKNPVGGNMLYLFRREVRAASEGYLNLQASTERYIMGSYMPYRVFPLLRRSNDATR